MFGIGLPELAAGAVLVLILCAPILRRARHGYIAQRALSLRVVAFLGGVANSLVISYAYNITLTPSSWPPILRGGILWLLLFEIAYRTRKSLALPTMPVYAFLYWLISPLLSVVMLFIPVIGSTIGTSRLLDYYSNSNAWLGLYIIRYPYNVHRLLSAIAFMLVSYFLINRALSMTSPKNQTAATWSGFHGGDMLPSKSQPTRLLCASAFLSGQRFRDEILSYLENKSHGASPELGVDFEIVAAACECANKRQEASRGVSVWCVCSRTPG